MNNPIIDYDNFILPVDDLDKAKTFYHDTLNFPIKFELNQKDLFYLIFLTYHQLFLKFLYRNYILDCSTQHILYIN